MIEEAQPHLYGEYPACRLVNHFHRNLSALHSFFQVLHIDFGAHVHIHAGYRRLDARIHVVLRDPVHDALPDRIGIAHDKARETQGLLERLAEQELIDRAGNAVQIIKRRHDGHGSFIHRSRKRLQVIVIKEMHRHADGIVIAAGFTGAVAHIMLEAGRHIILGG